MSYFGFTITATHDATPRVLSPENNGLTFNDEGAEDRLYLRRVLGQPLVLAGPDFDWLYAIETGADRCDEITVTYARGTYTWSGTFSMSGVEFDLDRCTAQVTITPDDPLECFLNLVYDDEVNIIEVAGVNVKLYEGNLEYSTNNFTGVIEVSSFPPPVDDPTDPNWTFVSVDAAWVGIGYNGTATWVRQTISTNCVSGSPSPPATPGWTLRDDDCAGSGTSIYSKPVFVVFDSTIKPVEDAFNWRVAFIVPGAAVSAQTLSNGRLLNTIIENLLDGSCPATVKSDFLGINPPGDAPTNAAYDAAPLYQNLIIFQASDVTRPNASQDATIGRTTLKKLLEILRVGLRLFWWFDPNGDFRIEHESYRVTTNGIDLTTYDADFPARKYARIQTEAPRFQRFSWQGKTNDADFDGVDIIYPIACGRGVEQNSADVITDITTAMVNSSLVSESGFVLVAAKKTGSNYYCITDEGPITGIEKLNVYLSWAYLHENLHTFERPFTTGTVNNAPVTFDSVRPARKQPLTVAVCPEDYLSADFNLKARTLFGWGWVEGLSYDFVTQKLTITVLH